MKAVFAGAAIALAISTAVFAQAMPSATDAEFVQKASVGNMFEMQEAELASQRATNPRLKEFAQAMLKDHGDAMKKLGEAAQKANLKSEAMLDKPHQAMLDNLKSFNGAEFDKVYQADQVAAHAETVALLMDYKTNGKNSDLKRWVDEVLPVVKGHKAAIDAQP